MSAPASAEPLERRAEAFLGVAFLLSMATSTCLSCACGHLGVIALPTSSLAVGAAGYAVARLPIAKGSRIFAWVCVVFAGLIFAKNVCDVLWFGHEPWLS